MKSSIRLSYLKVGNKTSSDMKSVSDLKSSRYICEEIFSRRKHFNASVLL